MSEYQYYEFRAIDRALTREEQAYLRSLSTRAEITSTSFTNEYHWGSFKGDPLELVARFFDVHVYVANWGSRQLLFGLPAGAVDVEALREYAVESAVEVQAHKDRVVLTLASEIEEPEWDEADESWMTALAPLRADIMDGDFRALYIAWLGAASNGLLDDEDDEARDQAAEPPVPPGLGQLSGPLESLCDFMRLEPALIEVAAERSAPLDLCAVSERELRAWIAGLVTEEKDQALLRLLRGEKQVGAELLRRFRADTAPPPASEDSGLRRTARELLEAAEQRAAERERREQEAAERARAKHLDSLEGREEELWGRVEDLVNQKKAADYDQAVTILRDLHDLAERAGATSAFAGRVGALRERHRSKTAFVGRLDKAGLAASAGTVFGRRSR